MKKLTKEVFNSILDHTEELIDANKFEAFYRYVYGALQDFTAVGEVTEFILSAGIDPLEYMGSVPIAYLANAEDTTNIDIPSNIKVIKRSAFSDSALREITFSGPVEQIMDNAFYHCKDLKSVKLPDGIKFLGSLVFANSGLESLEIPASIDEIGNNILLGTKCKPIYLGTAEQWELVEKPHALNDALIRRIEIVG